MQLCYLPPETCAKQDGDNERNLSLSREGLLRSTDATGLGPLKSFPVIYDPISILQNLLLKSHRFSP